MIRIMDVSEARKTILRRKRLNRTQFSTQTLKRTEAYFGEGVTPQTAVDQILDSIEKDGDRALRKWSALLDRFKAEKFSVPTDSMISAWESLPEKIKKAMRLAKDRITEFHSYQTVESWTTSKMGGMLGQRVTPIEKVGVYVPGGTAPLPSSLLMSVIPAQVAGVQKIVVATPPPASKSILAAAFLCAVENVFQVG